MNFCSIQFLISYLCYTGLIKRILISDKIYIAQSSIPDAGRGVFARISIRKGEVIETCPVIEIPEHDVAALSHSILLTYFYFFGKKKERIVVVLGFGSIYNHAYSSNAVYKEKSERTIDFIAIKDIEKGEEITVNYLQKNKEKHPLWFNPSTQELDISLEEKLTIA